MMFRSIAVNNRMRIDIIKKNGFELAYQIKLIFIQNVEELVVIQNPVCFKESLNIWAVNENKFCCHRVFMLKSSA